MVYKNNSCVTKTFYGVTFKPGSIHDVPGYINDPNFVRASSMPKEPPKRVDSADKPVHKSAKPSTKQQKPEPEPVAVVEDVKPTPADTDKIQDE